MLPIPPRIDFAFTQLYLTMPDRFQYIHRISRATHIFVFIEHCVQIFDENLADSCKPRQHLIQIAKHLQKSVVESKIPVKQCEGRNPYQLEFLLDRDRFPIRW